MRQKEAAAALGSKQVYLSRMENGKQVIRIEDLYRLARLYGKPIIYFFPDEEETLPLDLHADSRQPLYVGDIERSILFWANDEEYYGPRDQYQADDTLAPDQALRLALSVPLNARVVEVLPRAILVTLPLFDLMALAKDAMARGMQNKLGFLLEVLEKLKAETDRQETRDQAAWHLMWKAMVMLYQNRLAKDFAFTKPPPAGRVRDQLWERLPENLREWRILEYWSLEVFERHLRKTR